MARGPHWRHGRACAEVEEGRTAEAAGWQSRAFQPKISLMTYPARGAAHLATVLAVLLAMVAVAATGAKPMPPPPAPLNASAFSSSEDYYYDYYDYEYDVAPPNLNLSEFRLPGEEGGGAPHIPRYMLELYNDQATRRSHPLPGADLVRSFEATAMGEYSRLGAVVSLRCKKPTRNRQTKKKKEKRKSKTI